MSIVSKYVKYIPEFSTKTLFGIERSQLRNPMDVPLVFRSNSGYDSLASKIQLNHYFLKQEFDSKYQLSKNEIDSYIKSAVVAGKVACEYCQSEVETSEISLDHYVPYYFGGKTLYHNLKLSCKTCNYMKGSIHPEKMPLTWSLFKVHLHEEKKPKALYLLQKAKEQNPTPEELKLVEKLIVKELAWREERKQELESKGIFQDQEKEAC